MLICFSNILPEPPIFEDKHVHCTLYSRVSAFCMLICFSNFLPQPPIFEDMGYEGQVVSADILDKSVEKAVEIALKNENTGVEENQAKQVGFSFLATTLLYALGKTLHWELSQQFWSHAATVASWPWISQNNLRPKVAEKGPYVYATILLVFTGTV